MKRFRQRTAAFTLVEMLIVIVLVGIIAGAVVPDANPSISSQLENAARTLAADIDYCRSLAVANNSNYRLRFEINNNRYILEHSGPNAALDVLPPSPFFSPGSSPAQQILDFDEQPVLATGVDLWGVHAQAAVPEIVDDLEFGPLGETTRPEATTIYLAAGSGANRLYLPVRVNPVTGLTWVDDLSALPPPSAVTQSEAVSIGP